MTVNEALTHSLFDNIRNEGDYNMMEEEESDIDLSLPSDMAIEDIKKKLKEEILFYQGKMEEEKPDLKEKTSVV